MKKHAYLIEAHSNRKQLEVLLMCLDDPRNDIFIHVDSKSKGFEDLENNNPLKYSKLTMISRIKVNWGGYSQILVELKLIEEAFSKGEYERYHLISGVDLPVKTQDEIHDFFDTNSDLEFLHFDYENPSEIYQNRMAQYHYLRDKIDRSQKILCLIEKGSIFTQRIIGINRIKNNKLTLMKGANWFSITDECAKYVVENTQWIKDTFKFTKCCDEVFLQTLLYNSKFKEKLFFDEYENRCSSMRFIDWKRGNPYIFKSEDFDELVSSHYMFARKFDEKTDNEIIQKIRKHLKEEKINL